MWSVGETKGIAHFDLGGTQYVQTLAVSPDGSLLAAIPFGAGQTLSVHRIPLENAENNQ